jgi:hypothetical protein
VGDRDQNPSPTSDSETIFDSERGLSPSPTDSLATVSESDSALSRAPPEPHWQYRPATGGGTGARGGVTDAVILGPSATAS